MQTPLRVYLLAWIPMVPIAVANGVLRVTTYGRVMPELHAHQISTFTAITVVGAYALLVLRRWPTASRRRAWVVGGAWVLLTVVFEFGFGRVVMQQSWERLLHDYDLSAGRLWPLFLAFLGSVPAVIHAWRNHPST